MKIVYIIIVIIISLFIGAITTSGKKSQYVRLLDVFILGPLWIWVGITQIKGESKDWLRILLIFTGASTISYNAKNYIN